MIDFQAVASDIDKEEKAIKAGITRSELFFAALEESNETKLKEDSSLINFNNSSNKRQMDNITICEEGKGVDDNYLDDMKKRKAASRNAHDASSRRLIGKSLEDITSADKKTAKSASFCQLPSTNVAAACSPRAIQHSTVARLNERPSLDSSELGFGSVLKGKDNNNYEVAC